MTTLFVFNYSASPPLANDSIVAIYDAVVFCFYQHGGAAGVFFGYDGAGRVLNTPSRYNNGTYCVFMQVHNIWLIFEAFFEPK